MFEQLKQASARYEEIGREMARPEVAADPGKFQELTREFHDLEEIVTNYRAYEKVVQGLSEAKDILKSSDDPELLEMARLEEEDLQKQEAQIAERLKFFLIPRDPSDDKNTVVEVRAGTGGEEAALFAADLYRMYTKYAESMGWKAESLSSHPTGIGGYKEIIFLVSGKGVYGHLKYESGVHRVQRIPETESSGRIHTSTATVAVLPEAEDVEIEIRPEDLRIDVYRSSGPGGQSVNTTDSAVRITHLPSGLIVQCQDEKSQHKNKAKALKVLRARLFDIALREQRERASQDRRAQVGTGDRSAKIRTYNFPQSRISDHRTRLTLYRLVEVLDGNLDELIDALKLTDQARKLSEQEIYPESP